MLLTIEFTLFTSFTLGSLNSIHISHFHFTECILLKLEIYNFILLLPFILLTGSDMSLQNLEYHSQCTDIYMLYLPLLDICDSMVSFVELSCEFKQKQLFKSQYHLICQFSLAKNLVCLAQLLFQIVVSWKTLPLFSVSFWNKNNTCFE